MAMFLDRRHTPGSAWPQAQRPAQTQQSAPALPSEPLDPRDAYTALVGPNVCGYFAPDVALPKEHVSVAHVANWVQNSDRVTTQSLYVSLSARTLEIAACTTEKPEAAHPLAATHMLKFTCDAAAPRTSVHLYMRAPAAATEAADAGDMRLVHTQYLPRGFGMHVAVPLMLSGTERIETSIVLEALDDDGEPLLERSVLTTYVGLVPGPAAGTWNVAGRQQIAQIGTRKMQLRELFGFSGVASAEHADESQADTSQAALVGSDGAESDECPICISQPLTTLILPCTHALCLECSIHVRDSVEKRRMSERRAGRTPRVQYACPICRGPIKAMLALSNPTR